MNCPDCGASVRHERVEGHEAPVALDSEPSMSWHGGPAVYRQGPGGEDQPYVLVVRRGSLGRPLHSDTCARGVSAPAS